MVSGLVLLLLSSFFSSFGVLVVINDGVKDAALTFNCVVMLLLLWSGITFSVLVSSCAVATADEEVRRMILGAVDIAADAVDRCCLLPIAMKDIILKRNLMVN